jgi:hypothetical protein
MAAFAEPGFPGCAFVGANARSEPARGRTGLGGPHVGALVFLDPAYAAEPPDPGTLVLLYDEAMPRTSNTPTERTPSRSNRWGLGRAGRRAHRE